MAGKLICIKCGKEIISGSDLVIICCQKGGWCKLPKRILSKISSKRAQCELYNVPKYYEMLLCDNCGNTENAISWLTSNGCPKIAKFTFLFNMGPIYKEDELIKNCYREPKKGYDLNTKRRELNLLKAILNDSILYDGGFATQPVRARGPNHKIYREIREGNMKYIDLLLNDLYDGRDYHKVDDFNNIIKNVPECKNKIINELLKHEERTSVNKKQKALVDNFILERIEKNYSELTDGKEISEYILKKQYSENSKTKRKSKQLIKKYGLKKYCNRKNGI